MTNEQLQGLAEPTAGLRNSLWMVPRDPFAGTVLFPAFRRATHVRGAFGYFTTSALARLAPGLADYLAIEGRRLELVISPWLTASDLERVRQVDEDPANAVTKRFRELLGDKRISRSALAEHTLECFAWMLTHDMLEISVAIVDSTFHPKIYEFSDPFGNVVLAHGSGNFTDAGQARNVEQMTVNVSWADPDGIGSKVIAELDALFDGTSDLILGTIPLPAAVANDLIENFEPSERPSREELIAKARQANARWALPLEAVREIASMSIPDSVKWETGDFAHQGEAVRAWEQDHRQGILAMATGAGKTFTALISLTRALQTLGGPLLVVFAVPDRILLPMWISDAQKFGLDAHNASAGDRARKFRTIKNTLEGLRLGRNDVGALVVTYDMLLDEEFRRLIDRLPSSITTMLVADEVHDLAGHKSFRDDPPARYDLRLGLSATPLRQYDEEGSAMLVDYFMGDSPRRDEGATYTFGLDRAIGVCLVRYNYYVHVVELTDEEAEQWQELSDKIRLAFRRGADLDDPGLTGLIQRRRKLVESASGKLDALHDLLLDLGPTQISYTLLFATSNDPEQLRSAHTILTDLGIRYARITGEDNASESRVRTVLDTFRDGDISMLSSKKVLDQGFNVPEITTAIFLASSKTYREWTQRRGRVLRIADNKETATIHDFLVVPPMQHVHDPDAQKMLRDELERVREFGHLSNNRGTPGSAEDIAGELLIRLYQH